MDLILMRVIVRGARFIVGSLSARQASCGQRCSATWNPGMECATGTGSVARNNRFGAKNRQKDDPLIPKFGENSSLFFP